MVALPLYDASGKSLGVLDASESVFGIKVKKSVIHSALVWQLAGLRRGTASTKTKGEIRGGGRKPWKQKGTGRARAGSIRSPLWRGGGVTFGPKPRDYSYCLPKKVRRLAIKMAIADKAASGGIKVVEKLALKEAKTKNMVAFLKLTGIGSGLLIFDDAGAIEKRASRNLEKIKLISSKDISVFDILNYETLVFDKAAVSNLEERLK